MVAIIEVIQQLQLWLFQFIEQPLISLIVLNMLQTYLHLKEFGNIYTRIMNPTNDVLEKRMAAIEGGLACVTVGSGQAASTFALVNVCQSGDNFISSTDLYGGTVNLFNHTLKRLGIECRYADPY